jgi:hypothetical protein
MKIGDLIKHKNVGARALILDIYMFEIHELEYRNEEYAMVLFSGEGQVSNSPLQLLKDNWEVINEI